VEGGKCGEKCLEGETTKSKVRLFRSWFTGLDFDYGNVSDAVRGMRLTNTMPVTSLSRCNETETDESDLFYFDFDFGATSIPRRTEVEVPVTRSLRGLSE
jgi:hypothetical protein